jgi:heterodisulfide reductase subunit B
VSLPAANLTKVQDMKLDMVVNCAACYNRMKVANHEISSHPAIRQGVRDALDRDYDGSVKVRHLIEILLEDVGLPTIIKSLKRSLNGLKVACYYGCLLVRPPGILKFDDAGKSEIARPARHRDGRARALTGPARLSVAAAVCRCRGRMWWSS